MLSMHDIAIDAPRWRQFQQATINAGMPADFEHRWDTGITDIPHDWKLFLASRSRKVRSAMKRSFEKLQVAGGSELRVIEQLAAHEVEQQLRRGFEVEDRSWKSGAGTSVLRLPRIFRFYCRQAAALAASGNLELAFLEHAGQPIGFMYGLHAKGVYYPAKIGYDDQFAAYSPGQLLNSQMLERFQQNDELEHLDFHGPISPAFGRWATRTYRNGQLLVAVRGRVGRAACRAIPALRARLRALRNRWRGSAPPAIEIYPLKPTGRQQTDSISDCQSLVEESLV
jgi:CelD/BcsL family acetyltransferase involved in cellulose biosynthesis